MRLCAWFLCLVLLAAPATAQWKVAESPNFRLYATGSERDLVLAAAELEDFLALVRGFTGRESPPGPPLSVYLVAAPQAGGERQGFSETVGSYHAGRGGIVMLSRRTDLGDAGTSGFSAQHVRQLLVAYHELRAGGPVAFPPWFYFGLAEYLSTAAFAPERIEVGRLNPNRVLLLAGDAGWIRATDLLTRSPGDFASGDLRMRYAAQAWLLVHYLLRTPDMQPRLVAHLRRIASGEEPLAAWAAEGLPEPARLNARLQAYAASPRFTFTRVPRSPATRGTILVRELPASAADLLLPMARLALGCCGEPLQDAAAAVRAAAARHQGDRLAERALALADLRTGNREAARARIDRLIAAEGRDADLLRWRAESHDAFAEPEAMRAARRDFVAAFEADPDDWRTLAAYVRLFRPRERPVPASVMDALALAYAQAPQVRPLAIDYGAALARAGRHADAAAVLRPLLLLEPGGTADRGLERLVAAVLAGDAPGVEAAAAALAEPGPDEAGQEPLAGR